MQRHGNSDGNYEGDGKGNGDSNRDIDCNGNINGNGNGDGDGKGDGNHVSSPLLLTTAVSPCLSMATLLVSSSLAAKNNVPVPAD